MTDFDLVESNLRACFRALGTAREHAEMRRIGGIEVLSLGVQFQMFNAAFLAFPVRDEADFERRIATAAVHFGARGMEWSLWLCDGLLPEAVALRAQRILSRRGLTQATQMPGMIAVALQPAVRDLPACEVKDVESGRVLEDFCTIGSRSFRVPPDWFAEVFDAHTTERAPFRAWVGYAEKKPIATAATVMGGGALGIYNVATVNDDRRKGYAEAIVREIVARETGRHGKLPLVLQSTASGLSLYERMGFETVTRFRVWVS